ncbi:hypothetical protein EHEL_101020 [Encephalitozoon hellem ATCC 50504]|uniref:Uncharacterized protein n=1 Tax=Encephalitozoon hellem TaxID=27973 RepID=A0A9Q9C9W9_ENCHE|nr:uncharacterized protein EHEL_101020 [Encephalitozoon hellem ATCC 50504]AFM99195.1 hypothetical protein EHEL_101020 [Encephalitozoon hellem ATCC 50504]UTX44180.1 hypothetical protein GPU96_10g19700 [Encephalitozoon hellem]WEL39671.1 hypothetical protein PFJ87_10g01190 [Encephalitozoon hellem]|eukprot:XP_003888176.1 hypothetical protein EHEL_101020 [Encephalitozoon hellem ATCC 50504]
MDGVKIKTILLMKAMVVIMAFHFLPSIVEEKRLGGKIETMRRRFNLMLSEGKESREKLRMLKTLINNARHHGDGDIPFDGSVEEVREAYRKLKVCSVPVFLRLSSVYNTSIFFPVFLPVLIQSIKILRYRDYC